MGPALHITPDRGNTTPPGIHTFARARWRVTKQTRCSCCGKPGHDDKGCVSNRDNPLKEEILRKLPPGVRATVMKMRQLPPSQVMEAMNKVRDARRAERDHLKTSNQDKAKGKTEDTRAAKMLSSCISES